jgi:putative aminopeptidase FrvX
LDWQFLQRLSDTPSVATACRPIVTEVRRWLGPRAHTELCPDSYLLVTPPAARLGDIRVLFVAHMDEIGGIALGPYGGGAYHTRHWGCNQERYAGAALQAMDYLAEDVAGAFPIEAALVGDEEEPSLIVRGGGIRPYRTAWTFRETARVDGDVIEGKALDPRATLFAVLTAMLEADDPAVGVLLVMAEECAMDMARKAVALLQREAHSLKLIINADVPDRANLWDADLEAPAIRIVEGRNLVDPEIGIRMAERMVQDGVVCHLTAARSGSQTPLFSPLAPTVSVALPGDGIHTARSRMRLKGIERCVHLLCALARASETMEAFA